MFFRLEPSAKTLLLRISHLLNPSDLAHARGEPNGNHEVHALVISDDDKNWTYHIQDGHGKVKKIEGPIHKLGAVITKRGTVGDKPLLIYRLMKGPDGGVVRSIDVIVNETMRLQVPWDEEEEQFKLNEGEEGMSEYEVGKFHTDKIAENDAKCDHGRVLEMVSAVREAGLTPGYGPQ